MLPNFYGKQHRGQEYSETQKQKSGISQFQIQIEVKFKKNKKGLVEIALIKLSADNVEKRLK